MSVRILGSASRSSTTAKRLRMDARVTGRLGAPPHRKESRAKSRTLEQKTLEQRLTNGGQ